MLYTHSILYSMRQFLFGDLLVQIKYLVRSIFFRTNKCKQQLRKSVDVAVNHKRRSRQKWRQRSSLLFGGRNYSIPCRTTGLAPGDLKKRRNRRTDASQNGCFKKMDDHLVHTMHPTKPPPSQNGSSSKKFSSNHPCC